MAAASDLKRAPPPSGFMPRVIKVAPACAIMISTYEFGKAFFQKINLDGQGDILRREPAHTPAATQTG